MMKDALQDREKALENEFFKKQNQKLLDQLRSKKEKEAHRESLAAVCGVRDERFLDLLIEQGVRAENLAALVLVPLVAVAWADREIAATERAAVLDAAAELGVAKGTPAFELLTHWLEHKPSAALRQAWAAYVKTLSSRLAPGDRPHFAENMLRHARAVAGAAGGVLGLGPKTSRREREVLEELAKAFEV